MEKGSLASQWRKSHIQAIEMPYSGLIIQVRSITKKTIKLITPYLDRTAKSEEDKKPIGDTERSLILQEIVVPLHVIEPIVVMTEEEEAKDPDKYIHIEKIPLVDRLAILGFVLGLSPEISEKIMDAAKSQQLKSFQ